MRFVSLLALLALVGCDSAARVPDYSGPADYAYTLTVSCFCLYAGPIRVTVTDGAVTDARTLTDREVSQAVVDETALTLAELSAVAARAEREADDVTAQYDPTYGYPTRLDIDWIADAVDDEVSYRAEDFEAR